MRVEIHTQTLDLLAEATREVQVTLLTGESLEDLISVARKLAKAAELIIEIAEDTTDYVRSTG